MQEPIATQTHTPNKADAKLPEKVEAPGSASPAAVVAATVTPSVNLSEKSPNLEEHLLPILGEANAWDVYNNEARKVDNELVKDWTASLNSLLVFAAIFAAVLAAFIIESKKLLEQDTAGLMLEVMILYTNNMANGSHTIYTPTDFKPDGTAVSVNCLLFASLSASLVAALASVVALQWVAEYDAAITRGGSSPEDRAKRRQFRFAGVESWKMGGIIATLPLLLYFSVVLFFVGIIQWMLFLNPTVGYIVIVGAIIAALFYISSTIIAVLYVSAPFKSPITRWIYFVYRLMLVTIHRILIKARARSVPVWIESAREDILTVHKREDVAVATRNDLKYQAIEWLVQEVSISDDSRPRLALLVNHLLEWPTTRLQSREFAGAPWIPILNILAKKHLDNAHVLEHSHEEEQELVMLISCAALPGMAAMITPTKGQDYCNIRTSAQYWNQHCTNNHGYRSVGSNIPSALFLLVRDLPTTSLKLKDEMKATVRLAKWRNSEAKAPEVWKTVFDKNNNYSDEFFGYLICLIDAYVNSEIVDATAFKMRNLILSDFATITQRAASGAISSNIIDALIRIFERLISIDPLRQKGPVNKSDGCLRLPLCYAQGLSRNFSNQSVKISHRTITLLLARDLQARPTSDRQGRLNDVLGMLWLNRFITSMYPVTLFGFTPGTLCTMEQLHEIVIQNWVIHVDDSKESKETFRTLYQLFASGTDEDGQWFSSYANQSRAHLLSLLRVVDKLVVDDQKAVKKPLPPNSPATQPDSILGILCKMLKREQFKNCGPRPYTSGRQFVLSSLNEPFVRTIAYRALEIPTVQESMPSYPISPQMAVTADYMLWNMHESDHESIWKLRAGLISQDPNKMPFIITNIFNQVFTTPGILPFVQKIFDYNTSCVHASGKGHLLRHLDIHFDLSFQGSNKIIHTFNIQHRKLRTIPSLLMVSKVDDLSLLAFPANCKMECIAQVWSYLQSLKEDPAEFLGFLLELLLSPTYSGMTYSYNSHQGTIAVMLQAIEYCLEYPTRQETISLLHSLSKRALIISRPASYASGPRKSQPLVGQPKGEDSTLKSLSQYGKQVHDRGLTILATVIIYRRSNCRMLSCARPMNGIRPAAGWRSMYVD